LAVRLRLAHLLAEHHLHQRVEAAGRLVEDQQVGATPERGPKLHLLPVPVRESAHLLVRVELKTLDELVSIGGVAAAAYASEELERLRRGHPRPE
jgi:hypothetical protein